MGALGDPPSLKSRRSSLPIHKAKAAQPGTAWRAEYDKQHRFTAQTNRYKEALDDLGPEPASDTRAFRGRSPAEDIATMRKGQDVGKPQNIPKGTGYNTSTPAQERQLHSHNRYIQKPSTNNFQKINRQQLKITWTYPRNINMSM